jgi:uncharacterized Zn finger protein
MSDTRATATLSDAMLMCDHDDWECVDCGVSLDTVPEPEPQARHLFRCTDCGYVPDMTSWYAAAHHITWSPGTC